MPLEASGLRPLCSVGLSNRNLEYELLFHLEEPMVINRALPGDYKEAGKYILCSDDDYTDRLMIRFRRSFVGNLDIFP
jgi:hypothetical protein